MKFEELPIIFNDFEYKDGWKRNVDREGTISELLELWDIDDEDETSEMAQVLRHLKNVMESGNFSY